MDVFAQERVKFQVCLPFERGLGVFQRENVVRRRNDALVEIGQIELFHRVELGFRQRNARFELAFERLPEFLRFRKHGARGVSISGRVARFHAETERIRHAHALDDFDRARGEEFGVGGGEHGGKFYHEVGPRVNGVLRPRVLVENGPLAPLAEIARHHYGERFRPAIASDVVYQPEVPRMQGIVLGDASAIFHKKISRSYLQFQSNVV